MTAHATGTFDTTGWEETTVTEFDGGGKLTRVGSTDTLHGDIEAEATVEYILVYRADGSGNYVGIEYVTGQIGGRAGSFVLQVNGTFGAEGGKASWFVVPGTGTGDLRGLRGEGGHAWTGQGTSYTLDYDFA